MINSRTEPRTRRTKLHARKEDNISETTKRSPSKEQSATINGGNILGPIDQKVLTRSQVRKQTDGVVINRVTTRSQSQLASGTKRESTENAFSKHTKRKRALFKQELESEVDTKNRKKSRLSKENELDSDTPKEQDLGTKETSQALKVSNISTKEILHDVESLSKTQVTVEKEQFLEDNTVVMDIDTFLPPKLSRPPESPKPDISKSQSAKSFIKTIEPPCIREAVRAELAASDQKPKVTIKLKLLHDRSKPESTSKTKHVKRRVNREHVHAQVSEKPEQPVITKIRTGIISQTASKDPQVASKPAGVPTTHAISSVPKTAAAEDPKQSASKENEEVPRLECIACTELFKVEETIDLECNHLYCFPCIDQLFTAACQDMTMFPPRCCKVAIPLTTVQTYLSRPVLQRFQAKQEENNATDVTYCYDAKCAQFIRVKDAKEQIAVCPLCKKATCCLCKQAQHDDNECPRDKSLEDLKALAAKKRWSRCPKCKSYVSKASGCNHMTCRCGTHFDYVSGEAVNYKDVWYR